LQAPREMRAPEARSLCISRLPELSSGVRQSLPVLSNYRSVANAMPVVGSRGKRNRLPQRANYLLDSATQSGTVTEMNRPNDSVYELWSCRSTNSTSGAEKMICLSCLPVSSRYSATSRSGKQSTELPNEVFLAPTQPSKFFIGTSQLFLACSTGPDFDAGRDLTTAHFHERPLDLAVNRAWQMKDFDESDIATIGKFSFTPFFHWLRTAKGVKAFQNPEPAERVPERY